MSGAPTARTATSNFRAGGWAQDQSWDSLLDSHHRLTCWGSRDEDRERAARDDLPLSPSLYVESEARLGPSRPSEGYFERLHLWMSIRTNREIGEKSEKSGQTGRNRCVFKRKSGTAPHALTGPDSGRCLRENGGGDRRQNPIVCPTSTYLSPPRALTRWRDRSTPAPGPVRRPAPCSSTRGLLPISCPAIRECGPD